MARKRAESVDQRLFWTLSAAEAPGKLCRPLTIYPAPARMVAFAPFNGLT